MIFNAVYAVAMAEVRTELSKCGIVFKAKRPTNSPFWSFDETQHGFDEREIVEASFVDDSAIALVACGYRRCLISTRVYA